jgi:hypothetical protein
VADTTAVNIKAIAPELTTFIDTNTDGVVDLILGDVAGQITSSIYGTKQERAQRYLAAHLLSLAFSSSTGTGGGGALKREKVGDEEIEYFGSTSKDANGYDETPYGRTYLDIRKGCIAGFAVITP